MLTDDAYLPGVQVLLHTLRRHTRLRHPIIVMVTPSVSAHTRRRMERGGERGDGIAVRVMEVAPLPLTAAAPAPAAHVAAWSMVALTKLHLWHLPAAAAAAVPLDLDSATPLLSKVVYLDADMLVQACVDDLFDRPGAPLPAAAPDIFPPDRFNAGCLVVEPSHAVFAAMMAARDGIASYDGGDTGFLNRYFGRAWFEAAAAWRLPFAYNAQRTLYWFTAAKAPGYWEAVGEIKVLHYASSPKPWEAAGEGASRLRMGDLELLWWQAFTEAQLARAADARGGAGAGAAAAATVAAMLGGPRLETGGEAAVADDDGKRAGRA